MKTSKKLLVVVLALVMILACAAPAFADPVTYAASYEQDYSYADVAATGFPLVPSTGIDVTLKINSHKIGNAVISRNSIPTIHMSQSDCTAIVVGGVTYYVCYVRDVLEKADDASWLTFYNSSHNVVTSLSSYLYGVNDSSVGSEIFEPVVAINYRNGWMFRINGMYPLLNSADYPSGYNISTYGVIGATIDQAIVKNGDSIDLYFADADTDSLATRTLYLTGYSNNQTTLGLVIFSSRSYYDANDNNKWKISDYTQMTSCGYTIKAKINGVTVNGAFNNAGNLLFDLSDCNLTKGQTYSVEVLPTYKYYKRNSINYYIPYTTGFSFSFVYNY